AAAPAATEASQTASGAVTGDILSKLKDPSTGAGAGLGEAISGLGQAVSGASKDPYAVAPVRPVTPPIAPTPAGVVPIIDPRAAENQRQQLAMAMQRLNSGKLY